MRLPRLALAGSLALLPSLAAAFTGGVSGNSGKPPAQSCSSCHSGGEVPTLTFSGPATITTGQLVTYSLDVVTGATRHAGVDIATSDGTLGVVAAGTKLLAGEIVQSQGLGPAKTINVQFTLTAPSTPGTLTLFANGLSTDGSGSGGDGNAVITRQITIEPPPDLLGLDLLGLDLSGPPDLAPPADLQPFATGDLAKGPPMDEARWACDCQLGGHAAPTSALPLMAAVALLGVARIRRRVRKART